MEVVAAVYVIRIRYAGLCVSRLRNPTSVVCKAASLEEMYSVGCCTYICMRGYVFPAS